MPTPPRLVPSPDVLYQELGGEIVLLDLRSETYFGLDEIGARIWQLLHVHGDQQKVLEAMLQEYDVLPEQLQTDLECLLGELADAGLIAQQDNGDDATG